MKKRSKILEELIRIGGVLQNSSNGDDVTAEDEEKWADKIAEECAPHFALNQKRRQVAWDFAQTKWVG